MGGLAGLACGRWIDRCGVRRAVPWLSLEAGTSIVLLVLAAAGLVPERPLYALAFGGAGWLSPIPA